jgi:hypothetical protein
MTLYELTGDLKDLVDMLEEDPENEAIKETISTLLLDLDDKAEDYVHVICQLEADAEMAKAEKQRLAKKQSAAENAAKRMRDYLKDAMLLTGRTKIKRATCSIGITSRWETVIDVDVNDIPDEFKKITVEPKKQEITRWLKAYDPDKGGTNLETCDWAHLEQTESLTVR